MALLDELINKDILKEAIQEAFSGVAKNMVATIPVGPEYVFHTVPEVAQRLNCQPDTVRKLIKNGRKTVSGAVVKLETTDLFTNDYRVSECQLRRFIDKINASTNGTGF